MKTLMKKNYDREGIENKWREIWENSNLYKFKYKKNKKVYSIDTPPPYVSAEHLHAGHLMSYSQAEFIARYKRMRGYNVFYPMGFDDNGLPTERFVEKKYNIDKSKISKSDFVKLCLKETELGSKNYKQLWSKLGISVDWSKTYSTIGPLATKVSQWSLIDLYKKKKLYRSRKPVLWCTKCQTALAQADLESQEEETYLNYINIKTEEGRKIAISTTRPEFLPACVALYVNPNDDRYKEIIGKKAIIPLFNYKVPIKTSEEVDIKFGTGLMIVCTWGDQEDVIKWEKDKLPTKKLITTEGKLTKIGKKYTGLSLSEARKAILIDLEKGKYLKRREKITHFLKTHERCGTPVEFFTSKQWFIKISENKDTWLGLGKKLNWFPRTRRNDYKTWVQQLNWDWCISRQRYYGVPFPIWYCSKCDHPIFAIIKDLPVSPSENKPPTETCPKCKNRKFIPETDVMDTWATSSCTPFLIRELIKNKIHWPKIFPNSLRPNAYEIIRTWDFYSVVKSYYHFEKLPFKDVMISGHGVDEEGKKLSKRLRNFIPADKLLKDYGADAIRYWASGARLGKNHKFDIMSLQKGKKTTIKLWNVARFISLNLTEYSPKNKKNLKLHDADIWILEQLNKTIEKATRYFEKYEYAMAIKVCEKFFWSDFTDNYIEFIKYRLKDESDETKYSAQNTLYTVFLNILKLYASFLPFITEELFSILYKENEIVQSIHISKWPKKLDYYKKQKLVEFEQAMKAIDEIRKHKSEHSISLGKEIPSYKLKTKINYKKYGLFVKKVMRVKNLN